MTPEEKEVLNREIATMFAPMPDEWKTIEVINQRWVIGPVDNVGAQAWNLHRHNGKPTEDPRSYYWVPTSYTDSWQEAGQLWLLMPAPQLRTLTNHTLPSVTYCWYDINNRFSMSGDIDPRCAIALAYRGWRKTQ